jgi:hypothetical protein
MIKNTNRKGIFFTSMAIVIFILFLIAFTFYDQVQERKAIQKRIETMNSFLFSLEQDLQRQIYTSGFRTIFIFEKSISESGSYITNFNATLQEMFLNGSLYGVPQDLMLGATLSDIEDSIQNKADKINVDVNFRYQSFSLTQDSPWKVKVILVANLTMQDKNNLALWNKTETTIAEIPIENFEDPLYTVNTGGIIINKINKTVYFPFVQNNNVANLSLHAQNFFYANSSDAPSFLYRLQGLTSASPQGIESIVNTQKLSQQGLIVEDKSVVDHIYFSSQNPATSQITGMPAWFKLDQGHVDFYQARNLSSFP